MTGGERDAALLLLARALNAFGCAGNARAACTIVAPASHIDAKRAITAVRAATAATPPNMVYTVLFMSLLVVIVGYAALCAMHATSEDTEKDALLYRK